MTNTLQVGTAPPQLVCIACPTVQETPSSSPQNKPVCARGHKLKQLEHFLFWSKFMLPFGFLANLASILVSSGLVVAFSPRQYLEILLWVFYASSISAGLIGIVKSRSLYASYVPINALVGESRMRFYTGWLFFAGIVLILLLFAFAIESFRRTHPFIMEG
jgi:hypothetical protein